MALGFPSNSPLSNLIIKNTFIEFDDDLDSEDGSFNSKPSVRQLSDPSCGFARQMSAPAPSTATQQQDAIQEYRQCQEGNANGAFKACFEDSSEPSTEAGELSESTADDMTGCYMYGTWDGQMLWPSYDHMMDMSQANMYHTPVVWVPMQPAMMMQQSNENDESASSAEAAATSVPLEWEEKYTVMMRNLPNKYTQQLLVEELVSTGFTGCYDFLYLPIDPETNANKGYAFVNFTSPQSAWMFKMAFEGRKMSRFKSEKLVSVMPAALQGFEANYAHYSKTRVNRGDPSARPLFLRQPMSAMQARSGTGRGRSRRGNGSLIDAAIQSKTETYTSELMSSE